MMKTPILSLLLCAVRCRQSRNTTFTLNARGEVVADSAFIDPFVWINPTVEYEPLYSRTLFTPGFSGSYTVKLYRYRIAERRRYFSIVEIDCGSKQVLRMIQTDGWDKFAGYSPTSDYYKLVRLDDSTYALLFVGFNYASEPGWLTIVILRGGQATLVYNKGRHITSLTRIVEDSYDQAISRAVPEYARFAVRGDLSGRQFAEVAQGGIEFFTKPPITRN
ncbi:MAG: hypothetical protein ACLR76_01850 [Alistipes sp.]